MDKKPAPKIPATKAPAAKPKKMKSIADLEKYRKDKHGC